MSRFTKVLFAALLAVLVMSMAAGVASANRSLSLNNGGVRTFTYSGRYTFGEAGGTFRVVCEVLRVITFLRDASPKTARTLIATADVSVRNCSGGTVRILARGWPVSYLSFAGTLPRISTVTLQIEPEALTVRGGFLLEVFFEIARCLYGRPVKGIGAVAAGGEVTQIRAEEAPNRFTTNLGAIECPDGILTGILVPALGSPAIRLRLV